jgi:insertion element IS1 protein InsB
MLQEQELSGVGYLEPTLLSAQEDDVLELDEVWSFVHNRNQQVWIWLALCRRTRQIVAWMPGKRDHITASILWHKIPTAYKGKICFTDFWESYQKVIPPELHRPCAKQDGQTNHIERFNLTLRQRVSRMVRKSLSFSKNYLMHLIHLRHFFLAYNQQKAKEYRLRLAKPRHVSKV